MLDKETAEKFGNPCYMVDMIGPRVMGDSVLRTRMGELERLV